MLAENCLCPRHGLFLIERCPACGHELGAAFRLQAGRAVLVCGGCGGALAAPARQGRGDVSRLLAIQDRIGRSVVEGGRWREALEETIALMWTPLDRLGAARPVLSLDFPDGWRWAVGDRRQVAAPQPLGRLSLEARVATLQALGARFGAELEMAAPPALWRLRAADIRRAARPSRARPPAAPRGIDRFRRLAAELLAHPDWIAAGRLSGRRRRTREARLMERALGGTLLRAPPASEPLRTGIHETA
jgi:hypothetical protein